MRQTRYFLLVTFLLAAMTAQRVLAHTTQLGSGPFDTSRIRTTFSELTVTARQAARKLARRDQKPARAGLHLAPRLTLRRLRTSVARLLSALVSPQPITPFLFRLPPPTPA